MVNVARTTDPRAYPKGEVRVPRASVRTLRVQAKGHKFRVIGTIIGAVAGLAGGLGAAIRIQRGVLGHDHPGAAAVALIGITHGGALGGYLVGNRADRPLQPTRFRRSARRRILPRGCGVACLGMAS